MKASYHLRPNALRNGGVAMSALAKLLIGFLANLLETVKMVWKELGKHRKTIGIFVIVTFMVLVQVVTITLSILLVYIVLRNF